MRCAVACAVLGLLLGFWPGRGAAQKTQELCDALVDEASVQLREGRFPEMLQVAKRRQETCPGAVSSFLMGLALGNLIDRGLVAPSDREPLRQQAVKALQVAVAADLRTTWRDTAREWLEYLRRLEPPPDDGRDEPPIAKDPEPRPTTPTPTPTTATAPPAPERPFPWGPAVTGVVSLTLFAGALTTGVLGANRNSELKGLVVRACNADLECSAEEQQRNPRAIQVINETQSEVDALYLATNVLLIAGGVTAVAAIVWYVLLPEQTPQLPEGAPQPTALTLQPRLGLSEVGLDAQLRF